MSNPIEDAPRHCTTVSAEGFIPSLQACGPFRLARHQLSIKAMMDESNLGIFAEAGTGKTMIALSWIYDALISGRIEDALVICPASIVPSWELAIERMTEFEGYTDFDVQIMKEAVSIISFSRIWQSRKKTTMHRGGGSSTKTVYSIREGYEKPWGAIIIDESHALGGHSSIQTKACLIMAGLTQHRYVMTGTPDSGKYEKLYGQIRFLDPSRWANYKEFDHEVVLSHDNYHNPRAYRTDVAESLKREYGTVVRLRDCYDMPASTESDVPCPLESPKEYKAMMSGDTAQYGVTITASGTGYLKALQVCSGHYKRDDGSTAYVDTSKIDALMTIIQGREDKVVVFCNFTASIEQICATLAKARISYYRFDGTESRPLWQDFQKDDTRVFVTQYQRGGVGIDLFASCTMVVYEPTFSALLLEQAKARIMRKGQTRNCSYYYLYAPDTIEEKTMRAVRKGVDVSRELLDQWAKEENAQRRR